MSLTCNLTRSEYNNCSALFEGVEVAVTVLQACFAAIIFLVSVPINLLLITAMIKYHQQLDKAYVLSVSILTSNTVFSLFLNAEVFVTSILREWVFGYWGCQFFALLTTGALFSRCVTVGLLSVDRFCRVFFPFSYTRLANRILAGILITSWLFSFGVPVLVFLVNGTGFDVAQPGCSITIILGHVSRKDAATVTAIIITVICTGTVFPSLLYTAMYLKARSLRRVHPVVVIPESCPDTLESQQRRKRGIVTYGLVVVNFFVFTVLIMLKFGISHVFRRLDATSASYATVVFQISTLHRCYLFADLVIILTAKDERKVLSKLISRIFKRLTCRESTA